MAPHGKQGFVLVGDLVGSRDAPDRCELARTIESALKAIARRRPIFVAPPVTTKGLDEIAAVLHSPAEAFDVAIDLNLAVWPQRFRFGLADGSIDVATGTRDASAMDGTAFHRAADALGRARNADLPFALNLRNLSPDRQALIEVLARLHGEIMRGWTASAVKVVRGARQPQKVTQAKLARGLGLSQQAVSSALNRARASDCVAAAEAIRNSLGAISGATQS